MRTATGSIILIAVGVFFLLSNLGWLNISIADLVRVWWPVILIAVGVGGLLQLNSRK